MLAHLTKAIIDEDVVTKLGVYQLKLIFQGLENGQIGT